MELTNRALAAHLSRRAGFGATPGELDSYCDIEYEQLVEELINKVDSSHISDHLIFRRHVDLHTMQGHNAAYWAYRMISTDNPFVEKIALFWHGVFATAENKLNNIGSLTNQVDMFRRHGLGKYDDLLIELSRDPAMLIWLDNHTNHKDSINENYGREILELFSMGVGNYTEEDIKECARAFTGWTVKNGEYLSMMAVKDSIWPYGRILWHHEYRDSDHDSGKKKFLGENSNFNGDGVVGVICRQQATANFIARHLYNFFVADEVPVPQWSSTPPKDPEAVDVLANAYMEYDHDIRSIMRVLFNSDFFKNSRFKRVKSPAELIIGTLRNTGEYQVPEGGETGIYTVMEESGYMGQKLLDPPSVEGWHTGEEWITSGSLVDRVNFATSHIGDDSKPGVKNLISRVNGEYKQPIELVNACLEVLGGVEIEPDTYQKLEEVASAGLGESNASQGVSSDLIIEIFQLIVSSREFQRC
ncbi:MAG: DUF1800 domain-containing protein [Chloroflexota bacterium]|uniref:DUF1800 domain-containing protein n=1 Tax=marine metagenome TaxID=408172 RepID=A0A381S9I3_9ZZZZ|nr:hypothetical protein [Dehalococcoidia bacterium]MEC7913147.1 DUF1800 domain-containing protein [Chloroflexota bacterium]HAT22860.1 hypothetical protein [Dehalococcoidia bacterium]|tara:strand:- start:2519 stop:3937 length:1419 start_codon:yes stop_codon:yes gene_type:complete